MLLMASSVFASNPPQVELRTESNPEPMAVETPSELENDIDQTKLYINELSVTLSQATGDVRDALQLQLFQKNAELRKNIAKALEEKTMAKDKLVELVNIQQTYTEEANRYISERLNSLDGNLEKASHEEKLSYIATYSDLQQYLDATYHSSFENIRWLSSLGIDTHEVEKTLRDRVNQRLRLLSASVEYLKQQINVINNQIKSSPESEKANLQLALLFTQQRLDIVTKSLRSVVEIADNLAMETADYKRQIFQVTGSITQDLLNTQVVFSILRHWSNSLISWFTSHAVQHLLQVSIFLLILLAAKGGAKVTRTLVRSAVSSKNIHMSHLMQDFFVSISGKVVWVIGILVGLSQIGLNLAPVLTGFGIAGVIIGFALQDTLSNFAAGMMLLIYRPFDVGDFVHAGGVDGKVSHMSLVNTTIRTFDNQIIIVPNSKIWGDVIKNVTHERIRRVDMVFGIGYSDDLLKAEAVLTDIVKSHPAVLRTPEPNIKVHTLNTSSIDFIVRPWVKTEDYWDVYWDVTKEVKLRFDREGISIPFPQQDVHLHVVEQKIQEQKVVIPPTPPVS
ncbi:mechanosensitive ion channel family protein [Vibrio metoecus]|uniref:mechanosensitive ion channel family protein n=1 Tax=Vibrio metoecus TaxID=1481663 RepID=UPI00272BD798|nr:mechanosensitive ion channel family protein [Vibrio metoecus]WKY94396.1 mechanosensitive ion channel family protein [Vibrio metoecus]